MKLKFSIIIIFVFSAFLCKARMYDTSLIRLNNYHTKVLEIFNSCNYQYEEISKAIKAKKAIDIETARIQLLRTAIDGTKKLTTIEDFDGDPSLKFSCRETLKFYRQVAESDIPQVRDFFLIEDIFLKSQAEFKKKPIRKYSQTEISAFNAEIKKYNDAGIRYLQLISFITSGRKLTLYNWSASQKIFMETHKSKN